MNRIILRIYLTALIYLYVAGQYAQVIRGGK